MAYCRNCGEIIDASLEFCPKCNTNQVTLAKREPKEAKTGQKVAMWIFCIIGGLIGFVIAISIITSKYPDKTHAYNENSRTQAKIAMVICLFWLVLFFVNMVRNGLI